MSQRKPTGMDFETWVDRQIREAQERGEFDNLPGAGKPLPGIERPLDPQQWAADWVRREGYSTEAMLPPPLQLRREIHRLPETVRKLHSERAVRETVEELNARIKAWIRLPDGPSVVVAPVDVDKVVERWQAEREAAAGERDQPSTRSEIGRAEPSRSRAEDAGTLRRWWRRLGRNRKPGFTSGRPE